MKRGICKQATCYAFSVEVQLVSYTRTYLQPLSSMYVSYLNLVPHLPLNTTLSVFFVASKCCYAFPVRETLYTPLYKERYSKHSSSS